MALPTDNDSAAVQPLSSNRLVQFHLYKVQYELALARQSGDSMRVLGVLLHLAALYSQYSLLPQAISTLEQALSLVRLSADRHREGSLLYALAGCYQAKGEPDTALAHYRHALTIAEEIHDSHLKSASLDGLRRSKTAIVVETLHRQADTLLPPEVTTPAAESGSWRSVLIAMGLFLLGFVLLPIVLSQAGVSDGVVALSVIASSIFSLGFIWRCG